MIVDKIIPVCTIKHGKLMFIVLPHIFIAFVWLYSAHLFFALAATEIAREGVVSMATTSHRQINLTLICGLSDFYIEDRGVFHVLLECSLYPGPV